MKNVTLLFLVLAYSSLVTGAVVELEETGRATSYCDNDNPRCIFDLEPRSRGNARALRKAKANTEYQCTSKGGLVLEVLDSESSCHAITAWVDYYSCNASYKIKCETFPNKGIEVDTEKQENCETHLEIISLIFNLRLT